MTKTRLSERGPNPDAIRARVQVRQGDGVQMRENFLCGGHAGEQAGWMHFGLGDSAAAEVQMTLLDGTVGPWQTVSQGLTRIARDQDPVAWAPEP